MAKATSLSRIGSLPKDRGNLIFCNRKRLPTKMQTAARKEHVNFSSQNISLSPVMAGDRLRRLNSSIKEHQSMLGKLKSVVNVLKEHDSTLFQSNGLILKQGEEFAHDFNVKQIKCV